MNAKITLLDMRNERKTNNTNLPFECSFPHKNVASAARMSVDRKCRVCSAHECGPRARRQCCRVLLASTMMMMRRSHTVVVRHCELEMNSVLNRFWLTYFS